MELKSIVDFLNKQMERSEVLLVEARQYLHEGKRFVFPTLFGYTEEARQVKRTVSINTGQGKKWDQGSFFNDAKRRLDPNQVEALQEIFRKCEALHCEFSWGTGKNAGSFSVKWPHLSNYLIACRSNGELIISFGNFNKNEKDRKFRDYLKELVVSKLKLSVPDKLESKYPSYKITEWAPKVSTLVQVLDDIVSKYPASSEEER